MRIGALATQAGISTKAIRYYEQIGILTPQAVGLSAWASLGAGDGGTTPA
jgi:MerR family regulatory protein